MSNRQAVPDDQKFVQWQRAIEDRIGTLERRKTQGEITLDTLQTNGQTAVGGDLAVAGGLTVNGPSVLEALTVNGPLNFTDPALGTINDIQTGFANTGAGIAALTTAFQDLPGTFRTFTPRGANSLIHVTASFDMNGATTGWTQIFGCMSVNGVDNGIVAIHQDTGLANNRETHPMTHVFPVPLAGLTIGMRARKTVNAGTASIPGTISIWTWIFIDRD